MNPKFLHAAIVVLSLLVVGTQSALGTRYIPGDPDIGMWDAVNRIYTLITDVSGTVWIDEDNLTLDGAGCSITGLGLGNGVYLNDKTGVRIQNLSVSGFACGIRLNSSSYNALEGNTISDNNVGIYLTSSSDDNAIVGNAVNSNNAYGIWVLSSGNNDLTDNTVNSNWHAGIYLASSNNNTLSGNTTDSNVNTGIALANSSNNDLSDNAARYNHGGIRLGSSSNDNVLTDNTTASNSYGGISVGTSNGNTLTNNTADSCGHIAINLGYCSNNTLTGNTASNSPYGISLSQSNNNTLTGNTANSNSMFGIRVYGSGNNTFTGNIASNNYGYYGYGIWLVAAGAENNIFTGNTLSNNNSGCEIHGSTVANILTGNTFSNNSRYGVRLAGDAVDNQVYNNNFIDNDIQATVYLTTGSLFSKPSPVGGNYWSDYTGIDSDGDGFGDTPYFFIGGQDDLPWVVQDGWVSPQVRTEQLATEIVALNLPQGTTNSLTAKLETAKKTLEDGNENNDGAAVNSLEAFINAVNAQRGKKISEEDAEALIEAAQQIIDLLNNGQRATVTCLR